MGDLSTTTCDIEVKRKTLKRLKPGPPTILVCVPVGTKGEKMAFEIPECDTIKGGGTCGCPLHGQVAVTEVRKNLLVPAQWALSYANMQVPLGCSIAALVESGHLAAESRDKMTRRALEIGSKYIFYWDDDVLIPHLGLYTLFNQMERNPDIGLITGVYTTRQDPPEPVLYKEHGKGAYWGFSIDPADPPEDIYSAGAGCLLVRTEAVRKLSPPYWFDEMELTPRGDFTTWGHDVRFIRKVREESGMRTCVAGSVLCAHYDNDNQRKFKLPTDSPPHRRQALKATGPQVVEVEVAHRIDEEWLFLNFHMADNTARLFVVSKKKQTEEDLAQVLGTAFEKVEIKSMDDRWLAICEDVKDVSQRQIPGGQDPDGGSGGDQRGEADPGQSGGADAGAGRLDPSSIPGVIASR